MTHIVFTSHGNSASQANKIVVVVVAAVVVVESNYS